VLTVDDQLAIERLYAAYVHYIDSDRFDEWVALFAPDGVLVTSETYAGRAELAAFVRKRAELQERFPSGTHHIGTRTSFSRRTVGSCADRATWPSSRSTVPAAARKWSAWGATRMSS
jgi:hypothetical protein